MFYDIVYKYVAKSIMHISLSVPMYTIGWLIDCVGGNIGNYNGFR